MYFVKHKTQGIVEVGRWNCIKEKYSKCTEEEEEEVIRTQ